MAYIRCWMCNGNGADAFDICDRCKGTGCDEEATRKTESLLESEKTYPKPLKRKYPKPLKRKGN